MGINVGFTSPPNGSTVPATPFEVTGFISDDGERPEPNATEGIQALLVSFTGAAPFISATINADNTWSATGSAPAGAHHGDPVTVTFLANVIVITPDNPGDSFNFEITDTLHLVLEIPDQVPPTVTVNAFEDDKTVDSPPFHVPAITGTAGDTSGIAAVQYTTKLDNDPESARKNVDAITGPTTGVTWSINNIDFPVGRTKLQIFADDTRGNEGSATAFVSVRVKIPAGPVDLAFDTTPYLAELLGLANRDLRIAGAATAPTVADVAARIKQPLAAILDPAHHAEAVRDVLQPRLAVEVLRTQFTTPPPDALEQNHRFTAYQALLRTLGTDFGELRLARGADAATRAALAARIGVLLSPTRPDRLDQLLLDPARLTEAQLETLFGFRATTPDDLSVVHPTGQLLLWQRDALREQWFEADQRDRDRPEGALPVVDPDLVDDGDFVVRDATDPARVLWTQRGALVASMLADEATALSGANRTVAGFDAAVTAATLTADNRSLDLVALTAQEAAGVDIRAALVPFGVSLDAFRYLVRLRQLLGTAALTEGEWADTASILVQSRKNRLFRQWRLEELAAHVVLAPGTYVVDTPLNAAGPADPNRWRRPSDRRLEWLRTVHVRAKQAADLDQAAQAGVDSVEVRTLPALRDALLAELGRRQSPPEAAAGTAARLSRRLGIDLQASSDARTSRVVQAVDSVQELLVGARSGVFAGPGGDTLVQENLADFDLEFVWLSSYPRWRSAITAFAYPENQVRPNAFVDEVVTNDIGLAPTAAFGALIADLARRASLSPGDARNPDPDHGPVARYLRDSAAQSPGLPAGFTLTDQRTNQDLAGLRQTCAGLTSGLSAEKDIPQHVREVFWLVPMAVARKLQDSGDFQAALDWYRTVFAFNLPDGDRLIYSGLEFESKLVSDFGRLPDWLARTAELNPHLTARKRKGAYTKFTVMSIIECFLGFGDAEFSRSTPDSNARAQSLYQTAVDLLQLPEAQPEFGDGVPFPENPVWQALRKRAENGLAKIHAGLNIAGQTDLSGAGSSTLPSQYRYNTLVERAKNLVTTAQQVEASYLSALVQADNAAYSEAQAKRDLASAAATLNVEGLKVTAAAEGVTAAQAQRDKAAFQADHFSQLISAGLNSHEQDQLDHLGEARDLAAGAAAVSGLGTIVSAVDDPMSLFSGISGTLSALSQAASLDAQVDSLQASFERREQDWLFSRAIATRDVEIGENQITAARTQQQIAVADQGIAALNLQHATETADFLATKFTNSALFEWMSGVLGGVYAYFLQQATALARLAQAQLAFERQEPSRELIQADYWQGPPDPGALGDTPDRRGLTAAERLLQDLAQLDQFAFATDQRKLQLTQTLPLSRFAAVELQQFRQTGVLTFATPQSLFDAEFPGHYLRLIKRVRLSVLALLPPVRGLRATFSASGVSRAVVVRDTFDTVTLRRDPESIAFTSAVDATGLFQLAAEDGKLGPFEGMGVDTVWQLELPRPANPFDFRTIADVLLTIEYTALSSAEYRDDVIRTLAGQVSADATFSVRDQFADAWFALNNPDALDNPADRMRLRLPLTVDDFPRNLDGIQVEQLTLFVVRDNSLAEELTILSVQHNAPGSSVTAGPVVTGGGVAGTRHPGAAPWQTFVGTSPVGEWLFQLPDTVAARSWFARGLIKDLVVVFTVSAAGPDWP
ncbi:MAG: hypothetical protein HOV87_30270 [Catenulispora sp.]|nr:hypothetical protein [Catenulispora sp.]